MADREAERTVEVDAATMARIRAALQKSGRLTEDGEPAAFDAGGTESEPESAAEPHRTEVREVSAPATPLSSPDPAAVGEKPPQAVPLLSRADGTWEEAPPSRQPLATEIRPVAQEIVPVARTPRARPIPAERAAPVATVQPASLQQGARWELPTGALDPVPKADSRGNRVWPWMLATFVLLNVAIVLAGVVALGWGRTSDANQDPDPASVQVSGDADSPDFEPQSGGSDE